MTARPAIPDLPPGFVAGVSTIDVATASAAGADAPDWIKIAHRGELRCRDGRTYTLDPEAIVARFAADAVDVPIDLNHASVVRAPKGEDAPAFGWIKELQARPDGLYGRPDWLDGGRAILRARTHRYVSPAFHHDDANRATWLHSVALVAAPALASMPALAGAGHIQEPSMKGIATAVGLQADANETAILSALSAGFVKKELHEETLARLQAATTELTTLKKAGHDAEVERELDTALRAKKILPAQKEHLAKLSATVDGFAGVKAMLAATAAGVAIPSALEGRAAETGANPEKDAATLAAEAKKLAAERGISFTDAMSIVTQPKAA